MTPKETLLLSGAICTVIGLWWAWRSRSRFPTLQARYALAKSIKKLSDVERANILAHSPLETGPFQGEGFHVWHKGVDWPAGYVTSLGEVSYRDAEDWIIARWLEGKDKLGKVS